MKGISKRKKSAFVLLALIAIGLMIPQSFENPVDKADKNSFNPKSFWFYPWGKSGTHKGVDIFAESGTRVNSSTAGLVLFTGELKMGGKVVLILGPEWRLHYYAHLKDIQTSTLRGQIKASGLGR